MFLEFSICHKANKNSLQIRFLVTKMTKLYKGFMCYVITLKLNVHGKLETDFLILEKKGKVFI